MLHCVCQVDATFAPRPVTVWQLKYNSIQLVLVWRVPTWTHHHLLSCSSAPSPVLFTSGGPIDGPLLMRLFTTTAPPKNTCLGVGGGGCVLERHLQLGTAAWGSPGRPGSPRWRRCWAAESAVPAAAAGVAAPYLSVCLQTSPPKVRNSPEAARRSEMLGGNRSTLKDSRFIYRCRDIFIAGNIFAKRGGGE